MTVRDRFNISRLAIAHPWLTITFWLAVSVAGIFGFRTLRYALLPDITFPIVVISATTAQPISAAETADDVARPIERRFQAMTGLNEVRATIFPGRVVIVLSYRVGLKLEDCALEAENALQNLKLPPGTETKVTPRNLNQTPVATYALSLPGGSLPEAAKLARGQIMPALLKVPGVLEVHLLGGGSDAASPTPDADAGDAPTLVRLDGRSVLALEVVKRAEANPLELADRLATEIRRLESTVPTARFQLARSQADYIREATHSTREALLIAVALSILVIYPFLWSWPATAISALAIPTSLLGTIAVMSVCGFELDTITLLALALVIGIIIDDAIVDVENIARHLEQGGVSPREAALEATREIGLTVTAATLTIVAVFLPVAFMQGSVGQFFKPFGVTVSAAVVISLLVARTLSPLLAVSWLRPSATPRSGRVWAAALGWYRGALDWSLDHRSTVLAIAIASFLGGVVLIPLIPRGLIPRLDRGEFKLVYHVVAPSPDGGENMLARSNAAAAALEKFVRAFPDVAGLYTQIGSREGDPGCGVLFVRLNPARKRHTSEIEDQLRQKLPAVDGVVTSIEDVPFIEAGDQNPIEVTVVGDDAALVARGARALADRLRQTAGFVDVGTSAPDESSAVPRLEHLSGRDAVFLTSNLGGGFSLGEATQRVTELAREVLPPGVSLRLDGDAASIAHVFRSFAYTLALAVACIIAVLWLLFRNWVDPLVIALALPLAIIGAVLALLLVRSEFGMISLLGVVFLFGLVNKNAILLVDFINQRRATGTSTEDAIREAGPVRLRPILMTTLATVLGMLPVALGLGVGAELRAPMAVAIIGGLVTSTLLSLIVVPVVYALSDRWRLPRSTPTSSAR